jgi:hypothetical protein
MRYEQNAVLISLRRVQQFLNDNSAELGALNPRAREELNAIVEQLTALSVAQISDTHAGRGETARMHMLRLALRHHHMAPIAHMAKYKLQRSPEFAALTMPPVTVNAEGLVVSARSMAEAATPHAQTFIDSGLSPTFLAELLDAAQALSDSIVERGNLRGRRTGATAGLAAAEKRGRAMLRVLNALVLAQIGDDARLQREWATATAVPRKRGPSGTARPETPAGGQAEAREERTVISASTPAATASQPLAAAP